ncbi:hypothetical protein [Fibrobacter sp.]
MLKVFPSKKFSGYEFLAYYYVNLAIAEPNICCTRDCLSTRLIQWLDR